MQINKITISLRPYSHSKAVELLSSIRKEFGPNGQRWNWCNNMDDLENTNDLKLDFWFKDPNDALVFGLKYQQ